MPIYEYICHECGTTEEIYRHMADRAREAKCRLDHVMERIYSAPSLSIWDPSRPFPNAVKSGDGTFPTKAAYETHLKANEIGESDTSGKIYRPHGNKVIRGG